MALRDRSGRSSAGAAAHPGGGLALGVPRAASMVGARPPGRESIVPRQPREPAPPAPRPAPRPRLLPRWRPPSGPGGDGRRSRKSGRGRRRRRRRRRRGGRAGPGEFKAHRGGGVRGGGRKGRALRPVAGGIRVPRPTGARTFRAPSHARRLGPSSFRLCLLAFSCCDSCNVWPAATRRRRGTTRQDKVGQSTSKSENLAKSGFSPQPRSQPEHGVGLQVLMNNDINSSVESLNSACNMQSDTDTAPLLENGQHGSDQGAASSSRGQPQASPRQKMQRSQPMHILRRLQEEDQQLRTSSLPAIPNPFPELAAGAPASPPSVAPSSLPPPPSQPPAKHFPPGFHLSKLTRPGLWTKTTARFSKRQSKNQSQPDPVNPVARMPTPQMEKLRLRKDVKVFSEDGTSRVVEILTDMTARDLCQLLVYRSHCVDDNSWTLVEHHPQLGLERCLEDHEIVVQVESTMPSESKFLFRKNYAKYEFFKNPVNFFPDQMVNWCQQANGGHAQLLQNFLNSSSCPEIQGFLQVKEVGRKSWKKLYVCLRRSGLYYSTKGTSKEPRHLQLLADLEESSIFYVIAAKKQYNAPNEYGICIKPNKAKTEMKELRLLCAEDEQIRTCWITAFRLLKYGMLLYQNYRIPQRKGLPPPFANPPMRSVSENSLVAMDFSGQIGRVIDNPAEAQSAALEEGHAWRKRSTRMNILSSQSPLHHSTLNSVIHRTQHWFHGRISREESHKIIKQQGLVDGLFLLRDSQSNPKAFVLTLCHHQKIKNFQILPCEDDGQTFFTLDDGNTKFSDLIQLVDFYQLNRGVLPCKLKHHCIRVAL